MIVIPSQACAGSVTNSSSSRSGWDSRPGTGSTPISGQKKTQPATTKWTCSHSCSRSLRSVAS